MKYRAIILDLDGTTVVARGNRPSAAVLSALKKAEKITSVCIATSRPLNFAQAVLDTINPNGLCSVNNGTRIYDPTVKQVTQSVYLDLASAAAAYEILSKKGVTVYINYGDMEVVYTGGPMPVDLYGFFVPDIDRAIADDLIKSTSHIPSASVHLVPSYEKEKVCVCVTNALATKLHAVNTMMELLDINPKETIGVGDGYNDYPLLSACGLKIAMGNAVPELKAIADFIAPSVDEDGVAMVIEKFLLN